jgi:hypothetical protein
MVAAWQQRRSSKGGRGSSNGNGSSSSSSSVGSKQDHCQGQKRWMWMRLWLLAGMRLSAAAWVQGGGEGAALKLEQLGRGVVSQLGRPCQPWGPSGGACSAELMQPLHVEALQLIACYISAMDLQPRLLLLHRTTQLLFSQSHQQRRARSTLRLHRRAGVVLLRPACPAPCSPIVTCTG